MVGSVGTAWAVYPIMVIRTAFQIIIRYDLRYINDLLPVDGKAALSARNVEAAPMPGAALLYSFSQVSMSIIHAREAVAMAQLP